MKAPWRASGCIGFALIGMMTAGFLRTASAAPAAQSVYTDSLQNGWWGWGWATLDYSSTAVVHSGTSAIRVKIDKGDQALYLHHDGFGVNSGHISFWIDGGEGGGQLLKVAIIVDGRARPAVMLPPLAANQWTRIAIPFSKLQAQNCAAVTGIWIQDRSGHAQRPFFVDDIAVTIDQPYVPGIQRQVHSAALTVDAAHSAGIVGDRMFGLNTAVWDANLSNDSSISLLRAAGIRALRFPGGSTSDDYDWSTGRVTSGMLWSTNVGSFARVAEAIKATAYITVNYGTGTPEMAAAWVAYANGSPRDSRRLGTDSLGRDWKSIGYWATLRGSAPLAHDDGQNFLRVGHLQPFGYRYWEIGNECYGAWEADNHGAIGRTPALSGKPHDGATYGAAAAQYLRQMRAVDPNIRIGIVAGGDFTAAALTALRAAAVLPDFLAIHRYVQMDGTHQSDAALLESGSMGWANDTANVRKMITDCVGAAAGRRIELDCTETNSGSQGSKEGTSLTNGLFLADTVATMMQTELKSCLWWDFRNGETDDDNNAARYGWRNWGDDGMVSTGKRKSCPLNTPYPPYYAERLLSHWARGGDTIVSAKSDHPEIAVYAVRRTSGDLALLVINKQVIGDMKTAITIQGYGPVRALARGYRYGKPEDRSGADLTPLTYNGVSSSWSAVFPSYSMTVISLKHR